LVASAKASKTGSHAAWRKRCSRGARASREPLYDAEKKKSVAAAPVVASAECAIHNGQVPSSHAATQAAKER